MTEVLSYIGDDPDQVMQLGEGLRTARSHILTFVSDLGSARSSTNTAWMAAEATYADDESVGLLRSGDSISRSIDTGIRAVDLYSTELMQGRRTVDILREEWTVAKSQAHELESRTLLTPDEVIAANAFAARLTDQFIDLRRRYNTVLTSVDAAAEVCSRALTAAVEARSENVLAAFGKPPPEFYADRSKRHNAARDAAIVKIQEEVIRRQGNPKDVRFEALIDGFTAKGGNNGRADVYWDDGTVVWIWEVKGTAQPGMPIAGQGTAAVEESAAYVEALQKYFDANGIEREVNVGFPVDSTSTQYTDHEGTVEDLNVRNYGPGAVVYTIQGNDPTETVLQQMGRNIKSQSAAVWEGTQQVATSVRDSATEAAEAVKESLQAAAGGVQAAGKAVVDAAESVPEDVARAIVEAYGN